jgi:hypothetical protein
VPYRAIPSYVKWGFEPWRYVRLQIAQISEDKLVMKAASAISHVGMSIIISDSLITELTHMV